MIWINAKETKKEKALRQAILGFLFYMFTYSLSLIFIPGLFTGNLNYPSTISMFFSSYSLNFTGLIVNMVISLSMFVFLLTTNRKPETNNVRKILLAFCLLIYTIVNVTMINEFRYGLIDYFGSFSNSLKETSILFLPRIAELVLFLLIFFAIISTTVFDNKRFEKFCFEGIMILVIVSYLTLTAVNGVDFKIDFALTYIPVTIGKMMMYVGAPIALVSSIISLTKITKEPFKTITQEITIVTPTKIKKSKTKEKQEELIVEEVIETEVKDTFVETERYDELFETGLFHIQKKEFDRAIEYWERCVIAKPDFLPGWNNLGLAYKDIEQIDKAINCWSKALEINPNYAEAAHNLEVALLLKRKRK
ncbi:MAG: tetratricopeptide repeat protein [Candidatus Heimdallarchaeota archaeon]